jgi:hypothetical protein
LEQQQQRGTFDFAVHCHDALSAGGVSALSIAGIDSGGMQASVGLDLFCYSNDYPSQGR